MITPAESIASEDRTLIERARDMENVGFGLFVGALSLVGMAVIIFAISGPMAVS